MSAVFVSNAIVTILNSGGLSKEACAILLFIFGISVIFAIPTVFKIFLGSENDNSQK